MGDDRIKEKTHYPGIYRALIKDISDTCLKIDPEQSIVISAYFSYNGTLWLYISRRLWPVARTIPRVMILLSLRTISSKEISRYMTMPSFLRCCIAFVLNTTRPPWQ